jgi:hypothetical protein
MTGSDRQVSTSSRSAVSIPLSALGTNPNCEPVLGEGYVVSGVFELDLRQEQLMCRSPATTGV